MASCSQVQAENICESALMKTSIRYSLTGTFDRFSDIAFHSLWFHYLRHEYLYKRK